VEAIALKQADLIAAAERLKQDEAAKEQTALAEQKRKEAEAAEENKRKEEEQRQKDELKKKQEEEARMQRETEALLTSITAFQQKIGDLSKQLQEESTKLGTIQVRHSTPVGGLKEQRTKLNQQVDALVQTEFAALSKTIGASSNVSVQQEWTKVGTLKQELSKLNKQNAEKLQKIVNEQKSLEREEQERASSGGGF